MIVVSERGKVLSDFKPRGRLLWAESEDERKSRDGKNATAAEGLLRDLDSGDGLWGRGGLEGEL